MVIVTKDVLVLSLLVSSGLAVSLSCLGCWGRGQQSDVELEVVSRSWEGGGSGGNMSQSLHPGLLIAKARPVFQESCCRL